MAVALIACAGLFVCQLADKPGCLNDALSLRPFVLGG